MKRLIKALGTLTIVILVLTTWFVTTMNEEGLHEMLNKGHNNPTIIKALEAIGGPNYNEISWYWAKSVFAMPDDYKNIVSTRERAFAELIRLSNISPEFDIGWLRGEVLLELMLISIREKTLTTEGWVVNKYIDTTMGLHYLNQLVAMDNKWIVLSKIYNTPERLSAWGNDKLKTKKQRSEVGISEEEHSCSNTIKHPEKKVFGWSGDECGLNIKLSINDSKQ